MFFTRRIRDDSLHSKIIQICLSQSIRHRNQVVRIDLLEIILFHYGSTKSKTIWNTYIEKTKCRNLRHRIIGIDVTCSKLLRMLLILLGFLSTVNICYQESESVIPIVSCRKNLTSVKSVCGITCFTWSCIVTSGILLVSPICLCIFYFGTELFLLLHTLIP